MIVWKRQVKIFGLLCGLGVLRGVEWCATALDSAFSDMADAVQNEANSLMRERARDAEEHERKLIAERQKRDPRRMN